MRNIIVILMSFIFIMTGTFQLSAATNDQNKEKKSAQETEQKAPISVVSEKVTGQVSAVSKDFIAVVYQTDKNSENEIGLYIEGTPKIERFQDFEQIEAGDTVTVEYEKISTKDQEGKEFTKHIAKKIILLKKAPPVVETDTMISAETKE